MNFGQSCSVYLHDILFIWANTGPPKKNATPCNKGPGARFSKVPVTLRARNQIFKSKYKE